MRILHMIPDIGSSNGVMSVILNYAKAMPEDIKFDVVYFLEERNQTKQAELEALGGRVFKINAPSVKGLMKNEISRFFNEHKGEWQVLHINAPFFTIFIAPAAKKAGIKKICCHCHSTLFSLIPKNIKRNELLSKAGKHFIDKKFACSKAAGDYWYKKDYTVLRNGIDCELYKFNPDVRKKVRDDLELNDKLVVGHIGRTDIIQKNHPFVLEIFAKVYEKNNNARLMLVGAEPTEETTSLCKKYGIEDAVIHLGVRNDVNELLQAMDVFLFPSTSEGLGVAVVEAQAAGLGVLMSDTVPNEVVACDRVVSMSLDETADVWADKLIELSALERTDCLEKMKEAGWNIYDCANELIEYYTKEL